MRKLVLVFLCSCVLMSYGCAGLSKRGKGPDEGQALLEPQAILRFGDVPVPVGFKLLAQDSFAFESAGLRTCILKYRGKASPDRIVNFYKEQMPMYNWNLLNVVEYGDRLLNFDRENETCVIGLLVKGNTVIITVSLGPRPQIPKRSAKPVK